MARCGCAGDRCSCWVAGANGINVTGTGSPSNPFVISFSGFAATNITVADTDSLNLSIVGNGTEDNPYIISGNAHANVSVTDTSTLDLSVSGDGSLGDPFVISGNSRVPVGSSDPSTPFIGMEAYRSDLHMFQVWDGTQWLRTPSDPITFLPSLVGTGASDGNATRQGYYQFLGNKLIFVSQTFTWGTTTNPGSGTFGISLPFNADTSTSQIMSALIIDATANVAGYRTAIAIAGAGSSTIVLHEGTTGNTLQPNQPWTWAVGDIIRVQGVYRRT